MSTATESFEAEKKSTPFWKLYVCGYNGFKQIANQALRKDSKCNQIVDEPVEVDVGDAQGVIIKVETSLSSTFVLWGDGRISVTGWIPGTANTGSISDLLPGHVIQDISCVDENLMFVTKAGKLWSWYNYNTDKDSPPVEVETCQSIFQVRCGDLQSIATMDDGSFGEVVSSSNSKKKDDKANESSLVVNTINFAHQVQSVDCGKEHVLLLTKTGKVFSFGGGSRGQLGNGSLEAQIEPALVEALDGIEVTNIACGGWHSAVISNTGDVYSWGWNKDGQVGVYGQVGVSDTYDDTHDDTQPIQVQAVPFPVSFNENNDIFVVNVSCGSRHTAAVTSCGEVWTWGWGYYSQLGQGNRKTCFQPTKIVSIKSRASRVWCSQWNTSIVVEQE